MSIRKALITLLVSIVFSSVGIAVSHYGAFAFLFLFPFLFGISIPLANWYDLGVLKVLKIIVAGLVSVGLFYMAVRFSGTEFTMYAASGINSALMLWMYSRLMPGTLPNYLNYFVSFALGLLALRLSYNRLEGFATPSRLNLLLHLWTGFFAVGLVVCLKKINDTGRKSSP